jgi:hypothetical protein
MSVIDTLAVAGLLIAQPPAARASGPEEAGLPDQEVIAVVLEDLASYRGQDSPIDGVFSPNPLRLDPTPSRYAATVADLLRQNRPEKWRNVTAHSAALREAAQDLIRRTKQPIVLFTAGSAHVPLYSGEDPSKLSPFSFREAPIQASLPGYSNGRRLALLTLSIPWSIHGCTGTYVLVRAESAWRVRVRDFTCYM